MTTWITAMLGGPIFMAMLYYVVIIVYILTLFQNRFPKGCVLTILLLLLLIQGTYSFQASFSYTSAPEVFDGRFYLNQVSRLLRPLIFYVSIFCLLLSFNFFSMIIFWKECKSDFKSHHVAVIFASFFSFLFLYIYGILVSVTNGLHIGQ